MPDPKKPPRKTPARRNPPSDPVVPDRQTIETFLGAMVGADRDDALSRAQEVIYDAWEKTTARSRIALAHKALKISPLCADAYNLLADEAKTPEEARDLYLRGVEAGKQALGPDGFAEYEGHFWGFLETRPYMRARHGLALTLLQLGDENGALEHFRAMLKLNPNDNQGIRYLLLAGLIRHNDAAGAKALLGSYADEGSACWLYTRCLIAFREGKGATPAALRLRAAAQSSNEHVGPILAGTRRPTRNSSGYITVGGVDEASDYIEDFGQAWNDAEGAVAWLLGPSDAEMPPLKKRSRTTRK